MLPGQKFNRVLAPLVARASYQRVSVAYPCAGHTGVKKHSMGTRGTSVTTLISELASEERRQALASKLTVTLHIRHYPRSSCIDASHMDA